MYEIILIKIPRKTDNKSFMGCKNKLSSVQLNELKNFSLMRWLRVTVTDIYILVHCVFKIPLYISAKYYCT